MPADQQIVENNVDGIGSHIGAHGNLGVASAPLCGIDTHLNTIENHTAHDDLEICHCAVMGFRCGTAQADDWAGECDEQNTQYDRRRNDKDDGSTQNPIRFLRAFFTPPSGNERRNRHIECKE